jgi:argininosuccinate synthase
MAYSINKGLWGTSIGGKETLQSNQTLPEEAYPSPLTATGEEMLTIDFEAGEICGVNGKSYSNKVEAIRAIDAIASTYAIGRDMHVGDTIIGIKGRVAFEAAGPMVIIHAHKLLEKHTLTKWQQYWKDQIGTWYGMFLHEALYLEPVMRDCEAFLKSTQQSVTGRVYVRLKPYHYILVGIDSPYDLMKSEFGEYGEKQSAFTAEDIKGFTKVLGNSIKIYHAVHAKNKQSKP